MLYQTQNPHGGDIYSQPVRLDFSANINPLGTPQAVREAMKSALDHAANYPDPYCRKAVEAVSSHEGVNKDHILLGNGAAELIYTYIQAVKPKKAVIPVPGFLEYQNVLTHNGCQVIQHVLKPENNFIIDRSILSAISDNHPDAVFLCNPNNPTGMTIPSELLAKIVTLCEISGIHLFIDECFIDLTETGREVNPLIQANHNLFILKALTKTYALPGVRIGYGITSDSELLRKMSKSVQPWNVSVISQAAIPVCFLQQEYLAKSKALIITERDWLYAQLSSFGFRVYPSEANYLLFQAPEKLDIRLKKQGIAIRNCSNFTSLGPGWFRIAVRLHDENEILIQSIRQVLQETA